MSTDWLDVSDLTPRIAYTATASQTAFTIPFVFFDDEDLLVYQNDVLLTLTTDYTVTGAEDDAGGTLTLLVGATVGDTIVIVRDIVIQLTTHIPPSGPLDIPAINIQLSKLIAIDQRLSDRIARSLHFPDSDGNTLTVELPAAADRALKNLSFDADGNPTASTPVTGSAVSSVMIPVIAAATLALARTALWAGSAFTALFNATTMAGFRAALFDTATAGVNESITIKTTGSGTLDLPLGATGHITAGGGAYTGDDAGFLMNRTLAPVSGLLNSHGFRDETVATVNVTGSAFSGYASFDSAFQVAGTATTAQNHIHGFQARQIWNASGHCSEWAGFTAQPVVSNAAGIIDNAYGFFVLNANITGGGISNQYGYYGNTLSGATTSNYFIYQGGSGNPSVLPGGLYVGGLTAPISTEKMNVLYNGSTTQGFLFADTYASAGTLAAFSFYRNNSSVGSVTTTLAATAYNTSSDERLKTFTGHYSAADAIALIRADPVRTFTWDTTGDAAIGWGAQTSHELSPDLASPGVGEMDDDNWRPWGMDFSKRTPYLWAATANLVDRVEYLEAENTALKDRLAALDARLTAGGL